MTNAKQAVATAEARQRIVLDYLYFARRPVFSAQIARETGLTQQQVAGAVRFLHRKGLIEPEFRDRGSSCKWRAV
mgnify:CR=1 FL=1